VILLCQHDAESYHSYDPEFKPTVIYNPLTLRPGKPSEGNSKRFLAVGRFSHQHKGFDILIDAFHLFSQHNQEWKLDIVGEGPEEALYRQKIADYHLEDRICLHPFTNHIQDYYSEAQIYVLSSRWEGMPLVLMEAMSHGLPVISSDLPISMEIMGDNALYFPNGDIDALASVLQEATQIAWPVKSEEAIKTARRFDISEVISQWQEVL
jgi:glycosyltransferase involved in cell wall biosynthesis